MREIPLAVCILWYRAHTKKWCNTTDASVVDVVAVAVNVAFANAVNVAVLVAVHDVCTTTM